MAKNVSMPYVGLTSLHVSRVLGCIIENNMCQCPMSGSRLCTLPLKNPSVYAGFRPYFFVYLSELSDFLVQ